MHVLMAGASGLIGTALAPRLESEGHRVTRLVRSEPRSKDERAWNPGAGQLDADVLRGVDAVVHLCGASLASLWTKRRKDEMRNSRVRSTRLLAERIAEANPRPKAFVHASATGYYGSRGDEMLTEESPSGSGFLADLCREWEAASAPAQDAGVRVVHIRTAPVLSGNGGMLGAMLPAFRLGLGGRLGSGRQWMPWIALDDIAAIYARALSDESIHGPVNAVAPEQVTNGAFTRNLGRAVHRPVFLPVPALLLRLLPGGMGREALLASERVVPEVLERKDFPFEYGELENALKRSLDGPDGARGGR